MNQLDPFSLYELAKVCRVGPSGTLDLREIEESSVRSQKLAGDTHRGGRSHLVVGRRQKQGNTGNAVAAFFRDEGKHGCP